MSDEVYFGCLNDTGHYYFLAGHPYNHDPPEDFPWGLEADGGLQPQKPKYRQGYTAMHHKDGWTLMAWWDMTVDSRPASCSAFAVRGDFSLAGMIVELNKAFPEVFKRQTVDLYEEIT